jgi:hypothetical protein
LFGGPNDVNSSSRSYVAHWESQKTQIKPTEDNITSYPFFSQSDITVNTDPSAPIPLLKFKGDTLDIDILVDNQVVQNVKMNFPDFTAPMPLWAPVSSTHWRHGGAAIFIDSKVVTTNVTSVTISGGNLDRRINTATVTNGIWPTNWTTTSTNAAKPIKRRAIDEQKALAA